MLKEHLNCRVWLRYKLPTFKIFVSENPLIILENVGLPWVFGNIYKPFQFEAPKTKKMIPRHAPVKNFEKMSILGPSPLYFVALTFFVHGVK